MPTLAEKKEVVEDITNKLDESSAVYIANYSGMSVSEINDLRADFYQEDVTLKVYKNTLVKRAMDEAGGYEEMEQHLTEQNAFAFVKEELAAPAKIIKKFNEEIEKPQFKAALIDGDYYDGEQLEVLAAMKSKSEVLGDIVGLLMAPMSNVVSALQSPGKTIAGALETIGDEE